MDRSLPRVQIMDDAAFRRALARITHEIIETNQGAQNLCLLGVKRRGIPLSKILAENILRFEGVQVPVGYLDITAHRDDLSQADKLQRSGECLIPCDISGRDIVIVDDVLFTGRTARAAIESVFAHGRPKTLQLAVLIDRGHRELPIRPDYVGKNVPTSRTERICVMAETIDGENGVYLEHGES